MAVVIIFAAYRVKISSAMPESSRPRGLQGTVTSYHSTLLAPSQPIKGISRPRFVLPMRLFVYCHF